MRPRLCVVCFALAGVVASVVLLFSSSPPSPVAASGLPAQPPSVNARSRTKHHRKQLPADAVSALWSQHTTPKEKITAGTRSILSKVPTNPNGVLLPAYQNPIDGLNVYRQHLMTAVACALWHKRDLVLRPFRSKSLWVHNRSWDDMQRPDYDTIPFSEVYDVEGLKEVFRDVTKGVATVRTMEEAGVLYEPNNTEAWSGRFTLLTAACVYAPNPPDPFAVQHSFVGLGAGLEWAKMPGVGHLFGRVLRAFPLAPPLRPHIDAAVRRLRDTGRPGTVAKYACLHYRGEDDFNTFFKTVLPAEFAWYPPEAVLAKLEGAQSRGLLRVDKLFVAGDFSKDSAAIAVFRRLLDGQAFVKGELVDGLPHMTHTQKAVVDERICVQADVFIGNVYSSWSQQVFLTRVWDEDRQTVPSFMETVHAGNFRYNDYPFAAPNLAPFCSATVMKTWNMSCPHVG